MLDNSPVLDNSPEIITHSIFGQIFGHSFEQIFAMLDKGGFVMYILLLLSIFSLTIVLFKFFHFNFSAINRFKPIEQALNQFKQGDLNAAYACLEKTKNPAAKMMESAFIGMEQKLNPEIVREEVARIANIYVQKLRSYLRVLELIASLSPLLGLFGTVLGIISAFAELEKAGSSIDPSMLSGGIWVALMTTAAGLAVGMPSLAALNWLEAKIDAFIHQSENYITQVFTYSLAKPESDHSSSASKFEHTQTSEQFASSLSACEQTPVQASAHP